MTTLEILYSRLQRIRCGKYALSDDDIVDWLIRGVRSENAIPMLAAFHDLQNGTMSDFISYARQLNRRTTSTRGETTRVKPSHVIAVCGSRQQSAQRRMIINRESTQESPLTHALAAYSVDTARGTAQNLTQAPKRKRWLPQNEGKEEQRKNNASTAS
ncbi:hypothetical protein MRX96_038509 [Rhipicephalus microplus]